MNDVYTNLERVTDNHLLCKRNGERYSFRGDKDFVDRKEQELRQLEGSLITNQLTFSNQPMNTTIEPYVPPKMFDDERMFEKPATPEYRPGAVVVPYEGPVINWEEKEPKPQQNQQSERKESRGAAGARQSSAVEPYIEPTIDWSK